MPTVRTPALVLRAYDFSEADRVMVLFTQTEGKVRALAKGARRSQSRLAACLGLLTLSELQLYGRESQDLWLVTQGQLETAFPRIKSNLSVLGQAARMCELIDKLISDREPLDNIFHSLLAALRLLEGGARPLVTGTWFEISLLNQLGYRPNLQACQYCKGESDVMSFSVETGGVVCRDCGSQGTVMLSTGTRRMLEKCLEIKPEKVRQLHLHPQLQQEASCLLDTLFHYQLGRTLKSDVFRRAVAQLE